MPVIKHFTGNCHVYVDRAADLEMAERIVINAKCQRMGVCNAAESLLVHADVAASCCRDRRGPGRAGASRFAATRDACAGAGSQAGQRGGLCHGVSGPIISVKVVESLDEAIEHINRYGSQHTEAIVTRDLAAARRFTARVDSSAVMVNASTRFNDGFEFGLGAEIGISTDKFHARGPCGVQGADQLQIRRLRRRPDSPVTAIAIQTD